MGNEKTEPKQSCFVVMPFGGIWDDYYTELYSPAVEQAGLKAVRADDVFSAGSVLQRIVDALDRASVVLVDVTESNRNVHYELGLAHALGRPTVLIAPAGTPLFFDIGQERMIPYDRNRPFWGAELRQDITRALLETIADPAAAVPTAFVHIKPARVESDEVIVRLRRIEEQLGELSRTPRRTEIRSGYAEKLQSPLAAQDRAAALLRTMGAQEAVRQLMNESYPVAMAEDAVYVASKQTGKATP
jgi:hypothetical protein